MNEKVLTSKDFFYCYSKPLTDYLKSDGHNVITTAINLKTNTLFSMFAKSDELNYSINKYKQSL